MYHELFFLSAYLGFTKQSRPSLSEVSGSWAITHNLLPSTGEGFGHFLLDDLCVVLLLYVIEKLLSLHLQVNKKGIRPDPYTPTPHPDSD